MSARRIVKLPRALLVAFLALLLAVPFAAGPIENILNPNPKVTNAAAIGTQIPAWLINWIGSNATKQGAKHDLELIGAHCPIWAVSTYGLALCYTDTSREPSRWHAGTVETGGPILNARKWSTTSAQITRTFPNNWKLTIFCQQTGDWVNGRWGRTNIWDYIGTYGGTPWFVSDGYVNTGTNATVSGSCTATNWGDNPF